MNEKSVVELELGMLIFNHLKNLLSREITLKDIFEIVEIISENEILVLLLMEMNSRVVDSDTIDILKNEAASIMAMDLEKRLQNES